MAVLLPASLLVGCGQGELGAEETTADLQQTEQGLITTATPQRLAQLDGDSGSIQLTTTHVYFHNYRTIRRVPKAGGAVETLLTAPETGWLAPEFAVDDKYVWVGVIEDSSENFGHVVKVPLAGGEPVKTLSVASYNDIAVDQTWVYLALGDQVVRYPKEGLFFAPEVIASSQNNAASIAVDGANVYWIDMGSPNPANGCNPNEGKINAFNKFTRATRVLAVGENCPVNLVLDGGSLYWGNFGQELRKLSTLSYFGFPQTLARGVEPFAIAADTSYLYAASSDNQAGFLVAVGKLFGARYTFVKTRQDISSSVFYSLAADAQNLYYIRRESEVGTSAVFKLRK